MGFCHINVSVNKFSALAALIRQLSNKNLLSRDKPFSNMKLSDEHYLISINRNDRKKMHIYYGKKGNKEQILREIAFLKTRHKI